MKTLIFLLLALTANGQNLISNGSFENFTSLPAQSGDIDKAIGWFSNGGTPDYFHEFAAPITGCNIPNTFVGDIPSAYEGKACAGVCCYIDNWADYREYLTQKLDTPLKKNHYYLLQFMVLTEVGFPCYYGGFTGDNFSVGLSKHKKAIQPTLTVQGQLFANAWTMQSFIFQADSAYKYITFGCFVDDSVQQRHATAFSLTDAVYVFIDNVSLTEVYASAIEEHEKNALKFRFNYNLLGQRVKFAGK